MSKTTVVWRSWTEWQMTVEIPEGQTVEDYVAEHSGDHRCEHMDSGLEIVSEHVVQTVRRGRTRREDGALEELIEASREYVKLSDALPYKGALNRARLLDALEAIHPKEKRDQQGGG